jgi:hypothetical protein
MSGNTDVQALRRRAADKTPPRAALGKAFKKPQKSHFFGRFPILTTSVRRNQIGNAFEPPTCRTGRVTPDKTCSTIFAKGS